MKSLSLEEYIEECKKEAKIMYGVSLKDLGIDDPKCLEADNDDEVTPHDLIESIGEHYVLNRVDHMINLNLRRLEYHKELYGNRD